MKYLKKMIEAVKTLAIGLFSGETLKQMREAEVIAQHPRFNDKTQRIELTVEELDNLTTKAITAEELAEISTHLDYNPLSVYESLLDLESFGSMLDEVGHDLKHRYILVERFSENSK